MQPVKFCKRCRGMNVGWNMPYVIHCLACTQWIPKSLKLLALTAVLSSLVIGFPIVTGLSVPDLTGPGGGPADPNNPVSAAIQSQGVASIERMLLPYGLEEGFRHRVAQAVINSSRKYDVDPVLVASILIVESSGNPFAVSEADSVGIMQIHLPTWGPVIEKQGINVFKVEDNVDLGVRILKGYISSSGVWDGVARYKGLVDTPESQQSAAEYVRKVQRVYGLDPASASLD